MQNNTTVQIDSPGRRAAIYWYADGLAEIVFGLLFPAAVALTSKGLHWHGWWIRSFVIATGLVNYAVWFLHRRVLIFLKARITYPRTGYARPPGDFPDKNHPHHKILTLGTASPADDNVSSFVSHTIPFIGLGIFLASLFEARWGLPLVMSGVAAGVYFLSRNDARPYSWRAVLPIAAAGLIAAALNLEPENRLPVPMVIGGSWLLGIGTWTLIRYLRANPKPDSGQAGRL